MRGAGRRGSPLVSAPAAVQDVAVAQETDRMPRAKKAPDGPASVVPFQVLPFHHRARPPPRMSPHTAMQAVVLAQDRSMLRDTGLSLVAGPLMIQVLPRKLSARVNWRPPLRYLPLAKHTVVVGQDTPSSLTRSA